MLPESQLIGKKHGKLVIQSFSHKDEHGKRIWNCLCECGKIIALSHVEFSRKKTCGCFDEKRAGTRYKTHGMSQTSEWSIWHGIRKRCLCKTDQVYHRYGGRGITMCQEWIDSFEAFYADMGPRPVGKTIDRIDNNFGYSKENCRWVDWKTQQRNRRSNHLITFQGETKCLIEWAEQFGIRKDTLRRRIVIYKWTIDEALGTPVIKRKSA